MSRRPDEGPDPGPNPGPDPGSGPGSGRGSAPTPVPTLAPLRVPAYRRIWGAAVVSHLGTFLQMTAGPWLMWELTRSALMVSLVTTALLLPRLLLTLPAGALADVVDRRTLLIVGNLIGAVAVAAMAVMAAFEALTPLWLLTLTLALGSGSAIALPAFQTLVPDLVPRPLLPQAITLNSGAFNVARAVGPAIGGALVAAGWIAFSFGANAVSFLVVVAVLLTLPGDQVETAVGSRRHLLRATAAGMRYARFTPPIARLLAVTAGFTLTAASLQALLAPVAADLDLGGSGFGLLWGAMGVGALLGVAYRERVRVRLGAHMVPGSIVLFAVGGVAVGLAPNGPVAAIGMLAAGTAWVWVLITLNATVQLLAPSWVRSRVVSLYALVVGLQPIGAFLGGLLAERTGAGVSVAVAAAIAGVLGLVALRIELPVLGRVEEPASGGLEEKPELREVDVRGSVVVLRTWRIDPERTEEFLDQLARARRIRRRTGARSWTLYRDALDPARFTEVVRYPDWEEHVVQRTRLESDDVDALRALRAMDVTGGPDTRHVTEVEGPLTRPGRRSRGGRDRRRRAGS